MKKVKFFKKLALALSFSLLAPIATTYKVAEASVTNPIIKAQSAIVMDYDTLEVVYSKGADEKRYPASTTKLMTALLLAENFSKTDYLTYTEVAKQQPPYSINTNYTPIEVGAQIDANTIMVSLLLYSGNDMAYMIADNVGGDAANFAKMMNEKAAELGMKDTNFVTPNGLHDDNHYTTAYDMAILTKAAFENDWVKETLQIKEKQVVFPGDKRVPLDNRNKDLGEHGNLGGKTGYTSQAGGCFAGIFEQNDKKYISVIFKTSRNDNNDRSMFDDSNAVVKAASNTEKTEYKSSGEEIKTLELNYKLFKFFGPEKTIEAPVKVTEDILYYDNSFNNEKASIDFNQEGKDAWSVAFNSDVELTYSSGDYTQLVKGNIDLSVTDILKANLTFYLITLVVIALIIVLIVFTVKILGGNNRRRSRRRY